MSTHILFISLMSQNYSFIRASSCAKKCHDFMGVLNFPATLLSRKGHQIQPPSWHRNSTVAPLLEHLLKQTICLEKHTAQNKTGSLWNNFNPMATPSDDWAWICFQRLPSPRTGSAHKDTKYLLFLLHIFLVSIKTATMSLLWFSFSY